MREHLLLELFALVGVGQAIARVSRFGCSILSDDHVLLID